MDTAPSCVNSEAYPFFFQSWGVVIDIYDINGNSSSSCLSFWSSVQVLSFHGKNVLICFLKFVKQHLVNNVACGWGSSND